MHAAPQVRVHVAARHCCFLEADEFCGCRRKLLKAFYSERKQQFDISKVPDIYDSAKYDAIHNSELGLTLKPLYKARRPCVAAYPCTCYMGKANLVLKIRVQVAAKPLYGVCRP